VNGLNEAICAVERAEIVSWRGSSGVARTEAASVERASPSFKKTMAGQQLALCCETDHVGEGHGRLHEGCNDCQPFL
jgi:hypothetical protein